jgi:hypothetical protein
MRHFDLLKHIIGYFQLQNYLNHLKLHQITNIQLGFSVAIAAVLSPELLDPCQLCSLKHV